MHPRSYLILIILVRACFQQELRSGGVTVPRGKHERCGAILCMREETHTIAKKKDNTREI